MRTSRLRLPSILALAFLCLLGAAACTSAEGPGTPTAASVDSRVTPLPPTLASQAEESATGAPVNRTPVPPHELQEAVRNCLTDVSTDALSQAAPEVENCLLGIADKPLGFSAQAIAVEGALPIVLLDVANPECMFDEFIAWRSDGQWQLQYLNPLLSPGGANYADYRIVPATRAGAQTPPREVAEPQGIRLGVISTVANCGSDPHASLLLLRLDGDSWRIVWDARASEMAILAHTQAQFGGEGIDNIQVTGASWHLRDPQQQIFGESNPGPHRYFEETWTLNGDQYVLAEKHVRPSAYNTLVEFVYRLSTGDEPGAATLVTDETLVETAKSLGLAQDPLGQQWLIGGLDPNAECCGPIRILNGPASAVSFVQQGDDWLISDIQPGGGSPTGHTGSPTPLAFSGCLPRFDSNGIAGADVDSGPFTFHLALYTDPAIKSRQGADHPSRASDIPGVGWRAEWTYNGPTTELGPQAWGLLGNVVNDIEGGIEGPVPPEPPVLAAGQSRGRSGGGVVLPSGVRDGDQIGLGIKVRVLEGTYGAALFFTLREQDGRISACQVTVTEWTE